jgi:hypothetical protein
MADPVSVRTVERPGAGAESVDKTFIQASMPGVKVFFIAPGDNPYRRRQKQ